MYFLDSANIIAVGGDFEYGTGIIRSSDAGLTWNYSSLEVFGIATAIDFRKPGEAWVPLAYANKIIYSFDTCRTWNVSLFPEFTDFFDLKFIDSTKGFAVGTMGRIYKYTPEIVNVVREETGKDDVPASIKLRNYPNPFSEKTTIEMLLPEDNEISLRLYGVRGELIKELYSGFMESGIHRIPIPTAILSAGVYFVELTSGTEKARTKIVSLRR